MNFLKKPTLTSATRNLFTSALCGLSSAVLASSFALFAPAPEAVGAATVRDIDEDGFIDGVNDLAVGGVVFDVEFVFGSSDEVYSDGFLDGFDSEAQARAATQALFDFLHYDLESELRAEAGNHSYIQYVNVGYGAVSYPWGSIVTSEHVGLAKGPAGAEKYAANIRGGENVNWAKFKTRAEVEPASTPEPSLILGLITLGGLMLGSKRKTNG